MKFLAIYFFTFLADAATVRSQTLSGKQNNNRITMEASIKSDKEILSELNGQFIRNFINQDTVSHNKIIHKDFVCIEGSGEVFARDQYMRNWATDFTSGGFTSFSYTDEAIRIHGNSALVRSKTVYTRIVDGKEVKGNSIYTDVYLKENGEWKCIQAQITPIRK
jgi:ketosteroid isomerase-like protein